MPCQVQKTMSTFCAISFPVIPAASHSAIIYLFVSNGFLAANSTLTKIMNMGPFLLHVEFCPRFRFWVRFRFSFITGRVMALSQFRPTTIRVDISDQPESVLITYYQYPVLGLLRSWTVIRSITTINEVPHMIKTPQSLDALPGEGCSSVYP